MFIYCGDLVLAFVVSDLETCGSFLLNNLSCAFISVFSGAST